MLYIGKQYYLINVKLFSLLHTEYHHQELQKENTSLQSIFGIHAVQLKPNSLLFFLRVLFFIDHKHLVSHVCTFENMFVCQIREVWFAKTQTHFMSDIIFFSRERLADTIFHKKNKLPVNIKGNAKRNNPLQDIVLLYLIFAKYIIRIFLLI